MQTLKERHAGFQFSKENASDFSLLKSPCNRENSSSPGSVNEHLHLQHLHSLLLYIFIVFLSRVLQNFDLFMLYHTDQNASST